MNVFLKLLKLSWLLAYLKDSSYWSTFTLMVSLYDNVQFAIDDNKSVLSNWPSTYPNLFPFSFTYHTCNLPKCLQNRHPREHAILLSLSHRAQTHVSPLARKCHVGRDRMLLYLSLDVCHLLWPLCLRPLVMCHQAL